MTPLEPASSMAAAHDAVEARPRRPRIAYLSYSTAEFDSRTQRMAQSAVEAGYEVTVYARRLRGSAPVATGPGYHIVRISSPWGLLVPGLRRRARRRVAAQVATARATIAAERAAAVGLAARGPAPPASHPGGSAQISPAAAARRRRSLIPPHLRGTLLSPLLRWLKITARRTARENIFMIYPGRPIAWGIALEEAVDPADIWHGMWAGSLPAVTRLRRLHGGKSIYDSRDIYLHSRQFDRMDRVRRFILQRIERRWARAADIVITVNDAYADILARTLQVPRPPIVMNCPVRYTPPEPRPDLIRQALGLPADRAVILYQGNLITERGIEQAMDAVLELPGTALALLGYGALRDELVARAAVPPYADRVFVLPPVPPSELLDWTASSDVMVMAIQPTTLNHRYTTPQKLFEAFAAGVPVVTSDLPGMADIVQATRAGLVCDPTSPSSIAAALRQILGQTPEEREAMRVRAHRAAHDTYNWESQVDTLFGIYDGLLGEHAARSNTSATA